MAGQEVVPSFNTSVLAPKLCSGPLGGTSVLDTAGTGLGGWRKPRTTRNRKVASVAAGQGADLYCEPKEVTGGPQPEFHLYEVSLAARHK